MPGLEAALAPDLDIVVLDGDSIDARAQAGEEGESRAQVHRQQLLYNAGGGGGVSFHANLIRNSRAFFSR
jgi:hypothetical protein